MTGKIQEIQLKNIIMENQQLKKVSPGFKTH